MQRAALYIRVSTDDQIEYSPAAQRKALLDYAAKNDMAVDPEHIYVDEGYSGRTASKRPSFMRMIGAAKGKPKPFDAILVHKLDRFSRSREDSVVYKSLLRSECGIRVISITEQLEDDKFSIILESMLEAMAEYYSINLSEEVKKGMIEKALRGELQARPGYGYDVVDHTLVVNEKEATYYKLTTSKFLEGEHSTFKLAKWLNNLGARTKSGNKFDTRAVEYILRNPMPAGYICWTPDQHKGTDFGLPSTIKVKSTHPTLITEDEFTRIQDILDDDKIKRGYKSRPPSEFRHWLSGIMRCSTCGASMVYNGNRKHPGYQCRGYSGGKCEVSHSITLTKIEPAVISGIRDTLNASTLPYHIIQRPSKNTSERHTLERQLAAIPNKLQRAKDAYLDGIDTAEEYKQNKAAIQREEEEISKKLNAMKVVKIDEAAFKRRLEGLYEILTSETATVEKKSSAMRESIAKIIYDKEHERIDIYYYI